MNVGRELFEKMTQFKKSAPLMAKLLNTSLRERHWQYLMKKTGYECDLNPERFRLADIFAMDLYKYQVRQIKWLLWAFKVKKSIFDFCSDAFPINTAMEKIQNHRQIDVEQIIHAANNEVVIEQTMDKLIAKWNECQFTFQPHYRGAQKRAFTLNNTDEIIQSVENDSIELQMLSMSR